MTYKECFTYDWEDDPRSPRSLRNLCWLWLFDAQYQVVVRYRIARHWHQSRNRFLRRFGQFLMVRLARTPGIEVNCRSDLGKGIRFAHPRDVVIGEGTVVGERVTIYNSVTLGAKRSLKPGEDPVVAGRYPVLEDDVTVFPGARIVGGVTIGARSVVGANAVVFRSFPPDAVIAGVPARQVGQVADEA